MKEYQEHIDSLAKELGCTVEQGDFVPGMMYVEEEPPRIEGPTINTQSDYMVMMHELGHVKFDHTQGRPPYEAKTFYFDNGVLKSEAQAWEWALDTMLDVEMEEKTRAFMWAVCLGSYYSTSKRMRGKPYRLMNGNRHHVEFVFDEPDEYFWSIKERMLNGIVL